jgi:repressor LexA
MGDPVLTARRQQILRFIEDATTKNGYPPTVREIGKAVGLSSSSSVQFHLRALVEAGCLHRDGSLTRALRLSEADRSAPAARPARDLLGVRWLPVVGEVAAGQPIFADEQVMDTLPIPARFAPNGEAFMLRVEGDSMIEAGIYHGDYVIVSRTSAATDGDIVVALLDEEATVKRFYRHPTGVELRPANSAMQPILASDVQILGKVRGIIRALP